MDREGERGVEDGCCGRIENNENGGVGCLNVSAEMVN